MRLSKNFALREVAGTWVVLPLRESTLNFHGMMSMNESGAFLWKTLEQPCTREELALALTKEYAVDYSQALVDVDAFLERLNQAGCLEE